jgi:hypothetical protein
VDQFDGSNGSLRILGIDTDQDNFSVLILQLTHNRIARSRRETDMAQYCSGQVSALDPAIQYDGLFAVLREEGDSDPGHGSILGVHCHATNFQRRGQMTFVIEERTSDEMAGRRISFWVKEGQVAGLPNCKAKGSA